MLSSKAAGTAAVGMWLEVGRGGEGGPLVHECMTGLESHTSSSRLEGSPSSRTLCTRCGVADVLAGPAADVPDGPAAVVLVGRTAETAGAADVRHR